MDKLLTFEEAPSGWTPRLGTCVGWSSSAASPTKLGRYVRFHPDDLEEYISANRVEVGRMAADRPVVVVRRRRS